MWSQSSGPKRDSGFHVTEEGILYEEGGHQGNGSAQGSPSRPRKAQTAHQTAKPSHHTADEDSLGLPESEDFESASATGVSGTQDGTASELSADSALREFQELEAQVLAGLRGGSHWEEGVWTEEEEEQEGDTELLDAYLRDTEQSGASYTRLMLAQRSNSPLSSGVGSARGAAMGNHSAGPGPVTQTPAGPTEGGHEQRTRLQEGDQNVVEEDISDPSSENEVAALTNQRPEALRNEAHNGHPHEETPRRDSADFEVEQYNSAYLEEIEGSEDDLEARDVTPVAGQVSGSYNTSTDHENEYANMKYDTYGPDDIELVNPLSVLPESQVDPIAVHDRLVERVGRSMGRDGKLPPLPSRSRRDGGEQVPIQSFATAKRKAEQELVSLAQSSQGQPGEESKVRTKSRASTGSNVSADTVVKQQSLAAGEAALTNKKSPPMPVHSSESPTRPKARPNNGAQRESRSAAAKTGSPIDMEKDKRKRSRSRQEVAEWLETQCDFTLETSSKAPANTTAPKVADLKQGKASQPSTRSGSGSIENSPQTRRRNEVSPPQQSTRANAGSGSAGHGDSKVQSPSVSRFTQPVSSRDSSFRSHQGVIAQEPPPTGGGSAGSGDSLRPLRSRRHHHRLGQQHDSMSSADSDEPGSSSLISGRSETKASLQQKLKQELQARSQQDAYIHQLQAYYDNLLAKHALAEVTIDQLRLGAKINVDLNVTGGGRRPPMQPGASGGVPVVDHRARSVQSRMVGAGTGGVGRPPALAHSVSQPPEPGVASTRTIAGVPSGFHSLPSSPYAGMGATSPKSFPQPSVLEGEGDAEGLFGPGWEGAKLSVMFRVVSLQERLAALDRALAMDTGEESELSPDDQEATIGRLRRDYDRLQEDFQAAREQYSQVQGLDAGEDEFDPEHGLEGDLFQLGMRLDELEDLVRTSLRAARRRTPFRSPSHFLDEPLVEADGTLLRGVASSASSPLGEITRQAIAIEATRPGIDLDNDPEPQLVEKVADLEEHYMDLMSRYNRVKKLPPKSSVQRDQIDSLMDNLRTIADEARGLSGVITTPKELEDQFRRDEETRQLDTGVELEEEDAFSAGQASGPSSLVGGAAGPGSSVSQQGNVADLRGRRDSGGRSGVKGQGAAGETGGRLRVGPGPMNGRYGRYQKAGAVVGSRSSMADSGMSTPASSRLSAYQRSQRQPGTTNGPSSGGAPAGGQTLCDSTDGPLRESVGGPLRRSDLFSDSGVGRTESGSRASRRSSGKQKLGGGPPQDWSSPGQADDDTHLRNSADGLREGPPGTRQSGVRTSTPRRGASTEKLTRTPSGDSRHSIRPRRGDKGFERRGSVSSVDTVPSDRLRGLEEDVRILKEQLVDVDTDVSVGGLNLDRYDPDTPSGRRHLGSSASRSSLERADGDRRRRKGLRAEPRERSSSLGRSPDRTDPHRRTSRRELEGSERHPEASRRRHRRSRSQDFVSDEDWREGSRSSSDLEEAGRGHRLGSSPRRGRPRSNERWSQTPTPRSTERGVSARKSRDDDSFDSETDEEVAYWNGVAFYPRRGPPPSILRKSSHRRHRGSSHPGHHSSRLVSPMGSGLASGFASPGPATHWPSRPLLGSNVSVATTIQPCSTCRGSGAVEEQTRMYTRGELPNVDLPLREYMAQDRVRYYVREYAHGGEDADWRHRSFHHLNRSREQDRHDVERGRRRRSHSQPRHRSAHWESSDDTDSTMAKQLMQDSLEVAVRTAKSMSRLAGKLRTNLKTDITRSIRSHQDWMPS